MLRRKYKTTSLYAPEERTPLKIGAAAKPPSNRIFQIIRLFFKTLWLTRFGKINDHDNGVAWRSFFETMGGMWVKVGQLVAMRTDLFKLEFTKELSKLHYRVQSFPFEDVKKIVEENIGRTINQVFLEFDETPVGAASLAQVHKAKLLLNGELVAVKVQRPFAQELLKMDMKIIRTLFKFFRRVGAFQASLPEEMLWELDSMLSEEIDFRYEAINLKEAKRQFKKYKIYVPKVYNKLSSEKVLVMEYIEGVTMSEYIAVSREDPNRLKWWTKTNKIKPKKVGSYLLLNTWRQVYEDNYFHGDMQPGNIMLLAKSRLALIDLGSVGSTDEETLSYFREQNSAISEKNYSKAADLSLLTSLNVPAEGYSKIRQYIVRGIRASLLKASLTKVPIEEKTTIHNTNNDIAKEMAKFKISPNWGMMKLMRTFLSIDPSVVNLNPKMDLAKVFKKYNETAKRRSEKRREVINNILPSKMLDSLSLSMKRDRKEATDFKSGISKGVLITSYFLGLLKWAFVGVLFLFIWTYLYQHFTIVDSFHKNGGNWFTRLVEGIPYFSTVRWAVILILSIIFLIKFIRFLRNLRSP